MTKLGAQVEGRIWINRSTKDFVGQGRIELLEKIDELGSITKAAKAMGMSYKAAWDAIDTMNNVSPHLLVIRLTGGKGGGGTQLTEYARKLVTLFKNIEKEHQRFLKRLSKQVEDFENFFQIMRVISMQTSARNQFFGVIRNIKIGIVNSEIEITLKGNDKLVATLTADSLTELSLEEGSEVYALIKAPEIFLLRTDCGLHISARNCLLGTVREIRHGTVNAEVTLELAGGTVLKAVITHAALMDLGIQIGESLLAAFKASSVMLAVPA
ncbi:MAG: TOBE domain-containing protein [Thiotrichaceae bacterium]|nr:TOBE domain-containing protein [Thiotrichaceae bacterium]